MIIRGSQEDLPDSVSALFRLCCDVHELETESHVRASTYLYCWIQYKLWIKETYSIHFISPIEITFKVKYTHFLLYNFITTKRGFIDSRKLNVSRLNISLSSVFGKLVLGQLPLLRNNHCHFSQTISHLWSWYLLKWWSGMNRLVVIVQKSTQEMSSKDSVRDSKQDSHLINALGPHLKKNFHWTWIPLMWCAHLHRPEEELVLNDDHGTPTAFH